MRHGKPLNANANVRAAKRGGNATPRQTIDHTMTTASPGRTANPKANPRAALGRANANPRAALKGANRNPRATAARTTAPTRTQRVATPNVRAKARPNPLAGFRVSKDGS